MAQKRSRRDYEADQRKQEAPYVLYGTPLPLLDDRARDDGSYVPLWKQEVTDERGRKRLHGAFTGGFSAGYFNSVGSKEGWTPSTFVSSRSSRAKDAKDIRQQKVEDFMDEEDVRERDEAQQLTTAEGFAGFGTEDDVGVRHALDDIFQPSEDTTGEKLLNRMGWKKGQGIGPRIMRKIDPLDPNSEVREFPPEDSPMLSTSQGGTFKGLGFGSSEQALPHLTKSKVESVSNEASEDEPRPGLSFMKPRSKVIKPKANSGIGVGSLNDTGSDDDDPYEMGPKMSYNRIIGGDSKSKKSKASASSNANPLLSNKPVFIPKSKAKNKQLPSALTSLKKCHDGKLPLTGFVLVDELSGFGAMSLSDEKYKPPDVPEDWLPKNLASETSTTPTITDTTKIQQQQTAASRRLALNEPALPTKSVFDFLSPAARDRLAAASGNTNLPPALNEAFPTSATSSAAEEVTQSSLPYPNLDATTATTALQRLRKDPPSTAPYATDLPKQGRYKDFLRYSADPLPPHQRLLPLRAPQHKGPDKDEEHIEELAEFAATAELFKPVSSFFASRFTSASNEITKNAEGEEGEPNTGELLSRPAPKVTDPAVEAARMGMFGVATRSMRSWNPTRLLCKRFGVDMPVGNEE